MLRNARFFHARIGSLLLLAILAANLVAAPVPVAHAATTWYVQPASRQRRQRLPSASQRLRHDHWRARQGRAGRHDQPRGRNLCRKPDDQQKHRDHRRGRSYDDDRRQPSGTVITISPGVTVSIAGLTIRNGASGNAGGIYNQGALTITNSVITGNTRWESQWRRHSQRGRQQQRQRNDHPNHDRGQYIRRRRRRDRECNLQRQHRHAQHERQYDQWQ